MYTFASYCHLQHSTVTSWKGLRPVRASPFHNAVQLYDSLLDIYVHGPSQLSTPIFRFVCFLYSPSPNFTSMSIFDLFLTFTFLLLFTHFFFYFFPLYLCPPISYVFLFGPYCTTQAPLLPSHFTPFSTEILHSSPPLNFNVTYCCIVLVL